MIPEHGGSENLLGDEGPFTQELCDTVRHTLKKMLEGGASLNDCLFAVKRHLGIALSGGGFASYMQAGALGELEIPEGTYVRGASGGAVVGAIMGRHGSGIFKDPRRLDILKNAFKRTWSMSEYYSSQWLADLLQDCLGETTLHDFRQTKESKPGIDLGIVVTNLDTGETITLTEENCNAPAWKMVKASSAIPGIFKPEFLRKTVGQEGRVTYEFVDEKYYGRDHDVFMVGDGCVTENLPIPSLLETGVDFDLILAMQVLPGSHLVDKLRTLSDAGKEVLRRMMEVSNKATAALPELLRHHSRRAGQQAGTTMPVVATKAAIAMALKSRIIPLETIQQMRDSRQLIYMYPAAEGGSIRPVGPPLEGHEIGRLTQAGQSAVQKAHAEHGLGNRLAEIAAHNTLWSMVVRHMHSAHKEAQAAVPEVITEVA